MRRYPLAFCLEKLVKGAKQCGEKGPKQAEKYHMESQKALVFPAELVPPLVRRYVHLGLEAGDDPRAEHLRGVLLTVQNYEVVEKWARRRAKLAFLLVQRVFIVC